MADELKTSTCGVDHVGLSVRDLVSTQKFFCDCLGWRIVGEGRNARCSFGGHGAHARQGRPGDAYRRASDCIMALAVVDQIGLDTLYKRVASWPGAAVEFGPESSGAGPEIHFIVREPSGVRIEFTFDPCLEEARNAWVSEFGRRLAGKRRTYCE